MIEVLLWKNFVLQKRRPFGTITEVVLPAVIISSILITRNMSSDRTQYFVLPSFSNLQTNNTKTNVTPIMVFFPYNNHTKSIISFTPFNGMIQSVDPGTGKPFVTVDDAVKYIFSSCGSNCTAALIRFLNLEEGQPPPSNIRYEIRPLQESGFIVLSSRSWRTNVNFRPVFGLLNTENEPYQTFFLPYQQALDAAIFKYVTNKDIQSVTDFNFQMLPLPTYVTNLFSSIIQEFLPFLLAMAVVYQVTALIKNLVVEKQTRMKEMLKIMGLSDSQHFFSWLILSLTQAFVSAILISIVLKGGKILQYTNSAVIFLFFLAYLTSAVCYSFLVSSLFSCSFQAMLFGALFWSMSLMPYQILVNMQIYDQLSIPAKVIISLLLPNVCLGEGCLVLSYSEITRVGITWSNVFDANKVNSTMSLAATFLIFLVQSGLFFLLTLYIDGVRPGEYGIPKPWYFPIMKSSWFVKRNRLSPSQVGSDISNLVRSGIYEEEPKQLQVGVSIINLKKVYKSSVGKKTAVDGLTLNMFKEQITSLIGHNGAGKTTTMSMLTGLFPPTSGTALICGRDIRTSMDEIRSSLALCPQHNVLYDNLTVKEHLYFFARLKGRSHKDAKVDAKSMLIDLQLMPKRNAKSSSLSGGMKRKLSCGIALIGGSEVVILDEPTSGMDPYARRMTWDLLAKYKANRTIILSTHFMDEADHLGDRIAIMADGVLKCCGTSLFLKKRYGVGYNLNMVRRPDFNEAITLATVSAHVPTVKLTSSAGLEYSLQLEESYVSQFEKLLEELDSSLDRMGISSFGMSFTTLEEVFMKVGATVFNSTEENEAADMYAFNPDSFLVKGRSLKQHDRITGFHLHWACLGAMLWKRMKHSQRDQVGILLNFIVPVIVLCCGLGIAKSIPNTSFGDPARELDLMNLSSKLKSIEFYLSSDGTEQSKLALKTITSLMSKFPAGIRDVTPDLDQMKSDNNNNNVVTPSGIFKIPPLQNCCKYPYFPLNPTCEQNLTSPDVFSLCSNFATYNPALSPDRCLLQRPTGIQISGCNKSASYHLYKPEMFFLEKILRDGVLVDLYKKTPMAVYVVSSNRTSLYFYYSAQGFHIISEVQNFVINALLSLAGSTVVVTTINNPLPPNPNTNKNFGSVPSDLGVTLGLILSIAFLTGSSTRFIVLERTNKVKLLQMVSGLHPTVYWLSNFLWDFSVFLITSCLFLASFAVFNVGSWKDNLGSIMLLLILYGMCTLPLTYVLSFVFSSPVMAYLIVTIIMLAFSLVCIILLSVFTLMDFSKDYLSTMETVFSIFPAFSYTQSLLNIDATSKLMSSCSLVNQTCSSNLFQWTHPGIQRELVIMSIETVLFWIILVMLETNLLRIIIGYIDRRLKHLSYTGTHDLDEDVEKEALLVRSMSDQDTATKAMVLSDVIKRYPFTPSTSVNGLCLAVERGICFGLLGVNGAGKTTTFGMLVGDIPITSGKAFIEGINIAQSPREAQKRVGFCPQFDALLGNLTVLEVLQLFSVLRGIPHHLSKAIVEEMIGALNLSNWKGKLSGTLSGGNKRKLSTALALLGNPPIVLLDEPTSGMDPVARRFLWNVLLMVLRNGQSIVLTSHSMEECEALCSQLAIMVKGQFKCLGTVQHLKNRFAVGYCIIVKVAPQSTVDPSEVKVRRGSSLTRPLSGLKSSSKRVIRSPEVENVHMEMSDPNNKVLPTISPGISADSDSISDIIRFVTGRIPGANLAEQRQNLLRFEVVNVSVKLSHIFGTMQQAKKMLPIEDYSVGQNMLEKVFLDFASVQESP